MFIIVFLGVHVALGCFASVSGGIFRFGATMPERFVIHALSGGETTFNPTGSSAYHMDDLCLQPCEGCNVECYPYSILRVSCENCEIRTAGGAVLVKDNDFYTAVASRLAIRENVTFRCYKGNETVCGFEERLFGNYTLLHIID